MRPSMNKTSQKRGINALKVGSIWLFLIVAMAVLSLVALSVGSAGYSIPEILRALLSGEENTVKVILYNLRLPRLLLALLIGASLSASGALLQSVMRNPLADPYTLGVSTGAAFGATLTLPGIAGIVLTIGMSVDANVLIYERIREELKLGLSPTEAVDAGFSRASMSITDSNLTTIIAAAILYQFGTGPIRGFAVTLTLGIVASMFTAIFVSHAVFDLWMSRNGGKRISV